MKTLIQELPEKLNRPHILLVEDDPEDQIFLKMAFESTHTAYSINCVSSGKEALDYLQHTPENKLPDLIVMDFHLPGLNGWNLMQQLNASERYRQIEKVMLSTSSINHLSLITESPDFEHFTKPDSLTGLKQLAKELLMLCQNNKCTQLVS